MPCGTFESRRTGIQYKSNEISDYLNQYVLPYEDGDQGDLVLHAVWTTPPSEVRLSYILLRKLPAIIQKIVRFNEIDCRGIRAAYEECSRHWFRVLCASNASSSFANHKFYLVKFTLVDGRDDCEMICDRAVEFEEHTLQRKGFWSIFGRSAEQLSKQAEKACRNKEGRDLKIPQV